MTARTKDSYLIGTRESQLARLQTDIAVKAILSHFSEVKLQVVPIKTHGDKVLDKPIFELGDRGVFVKELEESLLRHEVDFVVHSLKDLPTLMPEELVLAAVIGREDPRDVLVARNAQTLEDLPPFCTIASSSRRRAAQMLARRRDLKFVDVRGNIPTRLRKLDEGVADAMILAAAGLLRLKEEARIAQYFPFDVCTPAVGQGALALQCRRGDEAAESLLKAVSMPQVEAAITAERAFLSEVGGGCSVPVGAVAEFLPGSNTLELTGCIAALDGDEVIRMKQRATASNAESLGRELAREMLANGGKGILQALIASAPHSVPPP